ncbi:hypothetical protein CLOSTMETH_02124 [[Clostridium] methylpentosum DSM 5476]|uniref:Uncharacterized protein n=1 Tax=[Clostridium] methylpentosum DSM 5476 TaxID=537013 RepID=C0EE45_9FIRM|nr:hypothetical protein CLOSTMETH_02124 [[Clostridium] methylpentosum DSM 5476]
MQNNLHFPAQLKDDNDEIKTGSRTHCPAARMRAPLTEVPKRIAERASPSANRLAGEIYLRSM